MTKELNEWRAILDAISGSVEDAMFICNDEGLILRGMDKSHIALFDIVFPKTSFEKFESKSFFFGIRIDDLKNIVNTTLDSDVIELQVENHDVIRILVNGTLRMEFHLKLIDNSTVNIPIPKIEYTSQISIEPNTLNRIFNNVQSISDVVTINCKPDKLQFFGKSEFGEARIDLDKNDRQMEVIRSNGNASATYNLDYLMHVIRNMGKTKNIRFEYATKNPLHMQFEFPSNTMINYYLAPRVD